MAKILVVEDDRMINRVLSEFLKESKYDVVSAYDGLEAWDLISEQSFDLIILDIMIPNMTGLEILKALRDSNDMTPVLMLTAMADEETQITSFNHLISDYVIKPFSPVILMKRVENILRLENTEEKLSIGNIEIILESETVLQNKEEVLLTKTQYQILKMLLMKKGTLVTREQLINEIWGYDELDSRVLDNHIKNLRKKLSNLPLKTIVGRGYQIEDKNTWE